MRVTTTLNDSQVMYWEPAKYVARLRTVKTDSNPLLLKIKMDPAGHGGASGRYDRLKDQAFEYAWLLAPGGLYPLPADEELHHGGGQPDIGGLADMPPRHRVQHPVHLGVDIRADLRGRPAGQHERLCGQRPQRVFLHRLEHRGRRGAFQRPARAAPRDLRGPAHRLGLHLLQRGELPAAPERVPDIRHRPFDPGLIPGFP